jgi:hypothetical protein
MKVKVFTQDETEVQDAMNKWLSENQNIRVISMTQSQSLRYYDVVITILYTEI